MEEMYFWTQWCSDADEFQLAGGFGFCLVLFSTLCEFMIPDD